MTLYVMPPDCSGNELRIVDPNGSQIGNTNEGRVEVCSAGQWGNICHSGIGFTWDVNDATVACRQLGFDVEGTKLIFTD